MEISPQTHVIQTLRYPAVQAGRIVDEDGQNWTHHSLY